MVIASSPPSSDDDARCAPAPIHGRGAASHLAGRFARQQACAEDDGWGSAHAAQADAPALRTEVRVERARRVISRNQSPDIGLRQSVNPYRGCEHGCAYCFARPSHAYLDLSPGLDFETRLFAKTNTAEVLRTELARPGYVPAPIALGINTDGWQPIERRYGISRACLEVLREARHPVSIVSKGSALRRDLDLLAALAREGLVHVYISVTTLDNRLSAIGAASATGVPSSSTMAMSGRRPSISRRAASASDGLPAKRGASTGEATGRPLPVRSTRKAAPGRAGDRSGCGTASSRLFRRIRSAVRSKCRMLSNVRAIPGASAPTSATSWPFPASRSATRRCMRRTSPAGTRISIALTGFPLFGWLEQKAIDGRC